MKGIKITCNHKTYKMIPFQSYIQKTEKASGVSHQLNRSIAGTL